MHLSNFIIILDVMLGVYLTNFVGAYLNAKFGAQPKKLIWMEWIYGGALALLILGLS
jgi:hypothetical protein